MLFRRLFLLFLFIVSFASCFHLITGGFQLRKVRFSLPINGEWKTILTEEKKGEIDAILRQKFFYLGKGRQSFVFTSEDGNYVLKLFRYHLVKPKFFLHLLRFVPFWDEYRRYRIASKRMQLENWMKSYKIAYDYLQKETGILFVHLTKTKDFPENIKIYDPLGREYLLDINEYGFLLQKKTELFHDVIKRLVKEKKKEALTILLSHYLDTIFSRHFKGVNNKDPSWLRNFGSIGYKEVYEIDVGRYTFAPSSQDREVLSLYLHRYIKTLLSLFEMEYPEMADILQNLVDEKIASCDF